MKKGILIASFIIIILGFIFIFKYFNRGELGQVISKRIIVIDAGHGGVDTGSIGYSNTLEKDVTLNISLKLGQKLEENGFDIYYTREEDVSLGDSEFYDLNSRIKIINNLKPDVFLSIHLNGSEYESARGVETYTRSLDNKSYLLGEFIQDELSSIEYTTDRGVKTTKDRRLAILNRTKYVGVLLELGFITNESDEEYLISVSGQDIIVGCIVSGVLDYFNKIQ